METVQEINKLLLDNYGYDMQAGIDVPKYRVVWTTDQIEKRYGEYLRFDDNGIFIRKEVGVSEEPKYGDEYKDMWVLEGTKPTAGNPYLERVVKWSYEPIWIFGAARSDRTPIWRAVRLLVENSIHGDPNARTKSPADLQREEDEKIAKERAMIKDYLKNESPAIPNFVRAGSGIFVPSTYEKEKVH